VSRTPLRMPKMSMTMTEGELATWHVSVGDVVEAGQVVCDVMTDKVDMEVETTAAGTVVELVAEPGDTVAVGEPLAWLEATSDGLLDDLLDGDPSPAGEPAPEPPDRTSLPDGAAERPDAGSPPDGGGIVPAIPRARRLAAENGVDLRALRGSGAGGAVLVGDVRAHLDRARAADPRPATSSPATSPLASPHTAGPPHVPPRTAVPQTAARQPATSQPASSQSAASPPALPPTARDDDQLADTRGAHAQATGAATAAAASAAATDAGAADARAARADATETGAADAGAADAGAADAGALGGDVLWAARAAALAPRAGSAGAAGAAATVWRDVVLPADAPTDGGWLWPALLVAVSRALVAEGPPHVRRRPRAGLAVPTPAGPVTVTFSDFHRLPPDAASDAVRTAVEQVRGGSVDVGLLAPPDAVVTWVGDADRVAPPPPDGPEGPLIAVGTGRVTSRVVPVGDGIGVRPVVTLAATATPYEDAAYAGRLLARTAEALTAPLGERRGPGPPDN
jgi:hypothetical protein